MVTRWHLTVVALCTLFASPSARADIYSWKTGEVIPGAEGIEPGPGVQLDHMQLAYARLGGWPNGIDLTGANLEASILSNALFEYSDLTRANLSGTDLTNAHLNFTRLANADLTGAFVAGAEFYDTTSDGFTKEQLYSTASYQARDLQHIYFRNNDFTGWDFSGQDLSYSNLSGSTLADADLTRAVVTGTGLTRTTSRGFSKDQLYSTASYQSKDLQEIQLGLNDLTGWDFGEQILTGAGLHSSTLTDASLAGANLTNAWLSNSSLANTNFTGSIIVGTHLDGVTSRGFTKEQLYSTASYQQKNLQGIDLYDNNLEGWDFSKQDLTLANLKSTRLTGANLSASNLSNANLPHAYLRDADLRGATLKNAGLADANTLGSAIVDSTTVYNQWTVFPRRFDPVAAGLTLVPSPEGDFNGDDVLDATDIDLLADRLYDYWRHSNRRPEWLYPMFDLDSDSYVNANDHRIWVKDLQDTWYGDADLDGTFNSGDMTQVFAAGKYEIGWVEFQDALVVIHNSASWSEGDWNGDGVFNSSDMVTAFVDGGYEKGVRTDVAAVPEPTSVLQ